MTREKITVELSREDRALLKSIRSAILLLGAEAKEEVVNTVRRLVETYPDDPAGAIEEHFNWNGSGWVPKTARVEA